MSLFVNHGMIGVRSNDLPEAAAALKVLLLLMFGEAEFGVEHVLRTCKMAERHCGGAAHFCSTFRFRGLVWLFFRC